MTQMKAGNMKTGAISVKGENWLAEINHEDRGWYMQLTDLDGLRAKAAQEAADAQHGRRAFYIYDHGTVLIVHNIKKYEDRTGRKHS
jgi:hypothetical protein